MADFQSWSAEQGNGVSPAGFEFGTIGWRYADPIPQALTFYCDNPGRGTVGVFDQYGRPIKGVVLPSGKEVRFAPTPPVCNPAGGYVERPHLASHKEVVEALAAEGIDWKSLTCAGTPLLDEVGVGAG